MILKSYESLIEIVATMTITLWMSRLSCFILLAEVVLSFVSTVNLFINLASFAFRMASLCYWRHKHSLYRFGSLQILGGMVLILLYFLKRCVRDWIQLEYAIAKNMEDLSLTHDIRINQHWEIQGNLSSGMSCGEAKWSGRIILNRKKCDQGQSQGWPIL